MLVLSSSFAYCIDAHTCDIHIYNRLTRRFTFTHREHTILCTLAAPCIRVLCTHTHRPLTQPAAASRPSRHCFTQTLISIHTHTLHGTY